MLTAVSSLIGALRRAKDFNEGAAITLDAMLEQGKQVLYMLPEIALTTQLISRLQKYFGEKISVYHSKYSTNERVEVWNNVLNNETKSLCVMSRPQQHIALMYRWGSRGDGNWTSG